MRATLFLCGLLTLAVSMPAQAADEKTKGLIYNVGKLPATDSKLAVKIGEKAPDFTLRSTDGTLVSLKDYLGRKNVVLSFVPAAWTPVCSDQWPGYNIARKVFEERNAVILGITADNIPTLYAWAKSMGGLWFPVLSDFWPHGDTAKKYGVLRSDGTTERALFVIDKRGVVRFADVHDINERPPLDTLLAELDKLL